MGRDRSRNVRSSHGGSKREGAAAVCIHGKERGRGTVTGGKRGGSRLCHDNRPTKERMNFIHIDCAGGNPFLRKRGEVLQGLLALNTSIEKREDSFRHWPSRDKEREKPIFQRKEKIALWKIHP